MVQQQANIAVKNIQNEIKNWIISMCLDRRLSGISETKQMV